MNSSRYFGTLLVSLLLGAVACDKKAEGGPSAASATAAPAPAPAPVAAKPAGRTAPVKYVPRPGGVQESEACKACIAEAGVAQFDCSKESGNAKAGPAAGVPRKQLCTELLDCLYTTKCSDSDPVDCYCGTANDACTKGAGNGSCREQIERALETTEYSAIAGHYADPALAGGTAMLRMDGSRKKCGEICGSRIPAAGL